MSAFRVSSISSAGGCILVETGLCVFVVVGGINESAWVKVDLVVVIFLSSLSKILLLKGNILGVDPTVWLCGCDLSRESYFLL